MWRNAIAHQDFDPAKLGGVDQLLNKEPWKNVFDANGYYGSWLSGLVAESEGQLRKDLRVWAQMKSIAEFRALAQHQLRAEEEAYRLERDVLPHYQELIDADVPAMTVR